MTALARIFDCLELLDELERPLSLPVIATMTAQPESSVAATLRVLVQLGYLHHDRSARTYAPTIRLAQLGGWVASRYSIGTALQDIAKDTCNATGENVAIAHRNDIRLQYLFFLPGKDLPPVIRVGTTRLLCRSGIGWALMSFLKEPTIRSIVQRTNAGLPNEDLIELDTILDVVAQCRADGYVRAEHTVRIGYGVIAMPLRTERDQLAIGVSGPVAKLRTEERSIVEHLRRCIEGVGAT